MFRPCSGAAWISLLSPLSHRFGRNRLPQDLVLREQVSGFGPENTSPYLRIEALSRRSYTPLDNTMETKAAYWEPRIKTYGFQRMTGLSLVETKVRSAGIESLGQVFCRLAEAGVGFHLVFSRPSFQGLEGSLLVTTQWAKGDR